MSAAASDSRPQRANFHEFISPTEELIEEARRRNHRRLLLHAQTRARRFYETRGFRAEGDEFMEAGIPHVLMALSLEDGTGDAPAAGR